MERPVTGGGTGGPGCSGQEADAGAHPGRPERRRRVADEVGRRWRDERAQPAQGRQRLWRHASATPIPLNPIPYQEPALLGRLFLQQPLQAPRLDGSSLSGFTPPIRVDDAPSLSESTFYVLVGGEWQLAPGAAVALSMVENFLSPGRGADFSVLLGIRMSLGG